MPGQGHLMILHPSQFLVNWHCPARFCSSHGKFRLCRTVCGSGNRIEAAKRQELQVEFLISARHLH